MQFKVLGEKGKPIVVMLTGSFCPGECLDYIYSRMKNYYIIVPTYNGHYKDSNDFTTRENEAREIREYLYGLGIERIHLIYGQSMGAEIGVELYRQLSSEGIIVSNLFFDGAPMVPYLSKNTLKNEVECCYTFDFPMLDCDMQKNTYFFYGKDEKAYKSCYKLVKKAYPYANYRIEKGHGHMTYSCEYTDEYVNWLKDIIEG